MLVVMLSSIEKGNCFNKSEEMVIIDLIKTMGDVNGKTLNTEFGNITVDVSNGSHQGEDDPDRGGQHGDSRRIPS